VRYSSTLTQSVRACSLAGRPANLSVFHLTIHGSALSGASWDTTAFCRSFVAKVLGDSKYGKSCGDFGPWESDWRKPQRARIRSSCPRNACIRPADFERPAATRGRVTRPMT